MLSILFSPHLSQLGDPAIFPAVIVEHVPGADILNSYAGLACVEEPSDMITESSLDVAEEEIIDDDDENITLTGVCASSSTLLQPRFRQCPSPVILGAYKVPNLMLNNSITCRG